MNATPCMNKSFFQSDKQHPTSVITKVSAAKVSAAKASAAKASAAKASAAKASEAKESYS